MQCSTVDSGCANRNSGEPKGNAQSHRRHFNGRLTAFLSRKKSICILYNGQKMLINFPLRTINETQRFPKWSQEILLTAPVNPKIHIHCSCMLLIQINYKKHSLRTSVLFYNQPAENRLRFFSLDKFSTKYPIVKKYAHVLESTFCSGFIFLVLEGGFDPFDIICMSFYFHDCGSSRTLSFHCTSARMFFKMTHSLCLAFFCFHLQFNTQDY